MSDMSGIAMNNLRRLDINLLLTLDVLLAEHNVTRAAEILDMHRQSLQHKLRQLGLGRRYVSVNGDGQDNSDT